MKASSVHDSLLRRAQRKLFILKPIAIAAVFAALSLCACTEEDGSKPSTDPETRALSREDSVQQGLVIDIDTAWAGINYYTY